MTRLERIYVLGWSLDDVQPAAKAASSGASQGETATRWQLCGTCDGRGTRPDRFKRATPCDACSGNGRYRVDAFTGQRPDRAEPDSVQRGKRVQCDRCAGTGMVATRYLGGDGPMRCGSCDGTGRVTVALEPPTDDDAPTRSLRSRGDWAALEHALRELRALDVEAYRAWTEATRRGDPPPPRDGETGMGLLAAVIHPDAVLDISWDSSTNEGHASVRPQDGPCCAGMVSPAPGANLELSTGEKPVQRADRFLLARMPNRVRVPGSVVVAWRDREARARRQEVARQARAFRGGRRRAAAVVLVRSGTPVPVVARDFGVSERSVRRWLAA